MKKHGGGRKIPGIIWLSFNTCTAYLTWAELAEAETEAEMLHMYSTMVLGVCMHVSTHAQLGGVSARVHALGGVSARVQHVHVEGPWLHVIEAC